MRRTLLMVGDWHGASRLGASALARGWQVLHTLSLDDVADAMRRLTPEMVVLGGSAALRNWTRQTEATCPVVTISGDDAQDLLASIVADPPRPAVERRSRSNTPTSPGIRAALEYIQANHSEDISLADTARMACYSRCHFSKVFKQQVGVGFLEYLNGVRVDHARQLLGTSTLSVTEVGLVVGFRDLAASGLVRGA